jgi:hypothetical protein
VESLIAVAGSTASFYPQRLFRSMKAAYDFFGHTPEQVARQII